MSAQVIQNRRETFNLWITLQSLEGFWLRQGTKRDTSSTKYKSLSEFLVTILRCSGQSPLVELCVHHACESLV